MGKTLLISWLATTLLIYSVAVGSPIRVTRDLPAKGVLYLLQEPTLNATITAVCEVIPECNVDTLTVSITILDGAQIIGKQHLSKSGKHYISKDFIKARKGVSYKYTMKIKVLTSPFRITADASGKGYIDKNGKIEKLGGLLVPSLYYYTDENTGYMRTIEQAQTAIVYHYNPAAGEFTKEADATGVEINHGIIKRIKIFAPALSDSEALALHSDMVQGIMFAIGISKKDASKPPKEMEDIIIKYLLKEGWLEKLKNGTKDQWFEKLKKTSKAKYDKS